MDPRLEEFGSQETRRDDKEVSFRSDPPSGLIPFPAPSPLLWVQLEVS